MTIEEYIRKYPDYEIQQFTKSKRLTVLKPRITPYGKIEFEELFTIKDGILSIGFWWHTETSLKEIKDIVSISEWFENV